MFSALNEQHIVCPRCRNQTYLKAIYIGESVYVNQKRNESLVRTSQFKTCSSLFGGDEVLRYSVNEMRKTIRMSHKVSILADDSTSGTGTKKHHNFSAVEYDEYVVLRAAVPVIHDMPPSDCSDHFTVSYKLHTTQVLFLNQMNSWRHVPNCFKTSGHVKRDNCFPR